MSKYVKAKKPKKSTSLNLRDFLLIIIGILIGLPAQNAWSHAVYIGEIVLHKLLDFSYEIKDMMIQELKYLAISLMPVLIMLGVLFIVYRKYQKARDEEIKVEERKSRKRDETLKTLEGNVKSVMDKLGIKDEKHNKP